MSSKVKAQLNNQIILKFFELTCFKLFQKLLIVKFEEAAGFECSQNLMDNLIQRYRTVDINFKVQYGTVQYSTVQS